jgi:hypothetical protein
MGRFIEARVGCRPSSPASRLFWNSFVVVLLSLVGNGERAGATWTQLKPVESPRILLVPMVSGAASAKIGAALGASGIAESIPKLSHSWRSRADRATGGAINLPGSTTNGVVSRWRLFTTVWASTRALIIWPNQASLRRPCRVAR